MCSYLNEFRYYERHYCVLHCYVCCSYEYLSYGMNGNHEILNDVKSESYVICENYV